MTRRSDQRGSVLMLVPAGFLILLLLGGVAVDNAVAILGHRQLSDLTADAANDAATEALDDGAFYGSGAVRVDATAAARVICATAAVAGDGDVRDLHFEVAVSGPVVAVRATGIVSAVFGRNVPAFAERTVSAGATATAAKGPSSTAPPAVSEFSSVSCTS